MTTHRNRPKRTRSTTPPLLVALLVATALPLAGCWEGPGPDHIRRAVEREVPGARFDREVHLRLGRLTTGLVRFVANRALDPEEDAEARMAVNAVRRVEVAVYTNRSDLAGESYEGLTLPRSMRRMLGRDGWIVMAEAHDPGSTAWVLVNQVGGRDGEKPAIRGLYVVALDSSELAVVRLEGRFDEAFARAFAERPHEAPERVLEDAES